MPKRYKEPATPTKSPGKEKPPTPKRTPKSSYKGDELGKNKKQSSILKFFTPMDTESPLQMVVNKPRSTVKEGTRKALKFPSKHSLVSEPIVISDEDSPRSPQASMDQFHAKTKLPQTVCVTKDKNSVLSRKSRKLKTSGSPSCSTPISTLQVEAVARVSDGTKVNTSAVKSPPHNDSDVECSPSKSFRKQLVADSQALAEVEADSSILKQITPNNKPKLLSTKSLKRKISETPSPPLVTSPQKKSKTAENSPVPRVSNECPETDQSVPTGMERFFTGHVTPPLCKENQEDSDENDSSQIFLNSPLRPNLLVSKVEPPALRVKPFLDLLSPRYLTDPLVTSMKESRASKEPAATPNSIQTAKSDSQSAAVAELPTNLQDSAASCRNKSKSIADSPKASKGPLVPPPGITPLNTANADRLNQTAVELPTKQPNSSTSGNASPSRSSVSCEPISATNNRAAASVRQLDVSCDLDQVNWSEPMEQEMIHASPVKLTQSTGTTRKLTPVKFGPLTPSKVPSTPNKSSGPSMSTQSTPRKSLWSPKKASPRKFGSPFKTELTSGNLLLQHCIEECKRYAKMALRLNATNKKVADDYISLDHPEKLLLHHLLMRKWTWIRQCDMKYVKFVPQLGNSLKAVQDRGFLECISADEDLEVILAQLKRPELAELCKSHKIDSTGTKMILASRLLDFANKQAGLGFTVKTLKSSMTETAIKMVGRCVRITDRSRLALQQIFEACMSPIFLEGKFYSFQERLWGMGELMDSVKYQNKKLIEFNLSDSQLFLKTSQFDEYLSSTVLKFDLLAAKERKDNAKGIELAKDAQASLLIYINSPSVHEYLEKMPRYAWRYTAGSNYTSAVDAGIELFKKGKDFDTAVLALDVLLAQERFRKHCRGRWYAEKVLILDKHFKKPPGELYHVIMTGLRDELTPIGRLELSKKAEILLNKKKSGLDAEQISNMRKLMRIPRLNHPVKQIKCIEAPNMATGTRQTFVEVSAEGDRTYCDVEQSAKNAYLDEYPEGLHDEGSLVKNIILAAFWPIIYMPMDEMFVSKYQHSPLDWGTRLFYSKREKEIKDHIKRLKSGGVEAVVQQITDVITLYSNSHSLIDWFKITHDMLPTIKNVITCLTVDKFLLLADYLLEAFRERRSGWPDLTLWNTVAQTFKLVEVKSPNDELSFKQIVWLEKFLEMKIPVEECRVNSSNKNKKRKAMAARVNNSDASQEVL